MITIDILILYHYYNNNTNKYINIVYYNVHNIKQCKCSISDYFYDLYTIKYIF